MCAMMVRLSTLASGGSAPQFCLSQYLLYRKPPGHAIVRVSRRSFDQKMEDRNIGSVFPEQKTSNGPRSCGRHGVRMDSPPGPRDSPGDPLASAWASHLNRVKWIPDASVVSCMICTKQFTLFRRRHHCRRCGACVCDGCSSARVPLRVLPDHRARKPAQFFDGVADIAKPLAQDTIISYVRACSKCAALIDNDLRAALRRQRNSPRQENPKHHDTDTITT